MTAQRDDTAKDVMLLSEDIPVHSAYAGQELGVH